MSVSLSVCVFRETLKETIKETLARHKPTRLSQRQQHAAGARSPLLDWALVHRALVWAAAELAVLV